MTRSKTSMFFARLFVIKYLLVGAALLALCSLAEANDAMFPAQQGAAKSIGWQGNYFVVKGSPTILWSGSIHYARIPRELWRERLVEAKRAGLNTIQTYVFWNAQEPQSGVFDFSDNLDLDAWLTTVQEVGLYSVVRMGPYDGGDWVHGGTPQWIVDQPGMQIRKMYPPYISAVDAEYAKILPILAKHQINRGGSLLFVQLENEYPGFPKVGGGTDDPSGGYLTHLYNLARSGGIEVPIFYSGLNHGRDPAGNAPFGDRAYPWYSTEFWSGWFDIVGELDPNRLTTLSRGAWHVVAFGGAGANFYMFNGGTNFGYSTCCGRTSYDYGAQIGEAGQLREAYFTTRAPQTFSQTFQALLATSKDGSSLVSQVASGLTTYVRQSPSDGIVVFLDNPGLSPIQTHVALKSPSITVPAGDTQITVAAKEIRPVVFSAPWTANATLEYLAANVLGKLTLGKKAYCVLYGRPGESGEIAVQFKTPLKNAPDAPWNWDETSKVARATFTYPAGNTITELPLNSGDGASFTFVVINQELANLTWFTDRALFVGATYVTGDLSIEMPPAGGKVTIYSSRSRRDITEPARTFRAAPPALGKWQWRDAAAEAAPQYDDSQWATSFEPESFGVYGFQNGYGWYRAKFNAPSAGNMSFNIANLKKWAMVFMNGQKVELSPTNAGSFNAIAGENTIAIFAWNNGVDTYSIGKPTPDSDVGIWGEVTGSDGKPLAKSWRFRGGVGGIAETAVIGRVTNWKNFLSGTWVSSASGKGPSFWMTTFKSPLQAGAFVTVGLNTKGLSSGSVWVNGHNIGRFSGNTLLYVPECWLAANNTMVIYDVFGNSPTGVQLQYFETRARYATSTVAAGGD